MAYRVVALLLAIAFVAQSCTAQPQVCPEVHRNENASAIQLLEVINLVTERLVNTSGFVKSFQANFTYEGNKLAKRHTHVTREYMEEMLYLLSESLNLIADSRNISTRNCQETFGLQVQINRIDADVRVCRSNTSALACVAEYGASFAAVGSDFQTQAEQAKRDVDKLLNILQQLVNSNRQALQALRNLLYQSLFAGQAFTTCVLKSDKTRTGEGMKRTCDRRYCILNNLKKHPQQKLGDKKTTVKS